MSSGTRARSTKNRFGWLELIRPPNLFTVPGDVFAGAALAGFDSVHLPLLIAAVVISLLLYNSGLILNDYADREQDARERPQRPIPSGRVQARSARSVALLLGVAAVLFSGLAGPRITVIVLVLTGLILAYDGPARRVPWLGFVVMGLCRGGNVYLGAAAVDRLAAVSVAVGAMLAAAYIAGVTALAHAEAQGPDAAKKQKRIGCLIRGLILFQGLCVVVPAAHNPPWFTAAAIILLLLMFMGALRTARVFYGS